VENNEHWQKVILLF